MRIISLNTALIPLSGPTLIGWFGGKNSLLKMSRKVIFFNLLVFACLTFHPNTADAGIGRAISEAISEIFSIFVKRGSKAEKKIDDGLNFGGKAEKKIDDGLNFGSTTKHEPWLNSTGDTLSLNFWDWIAFHGPRVSARTLHQYLKSDDTNTPDYLPTEQISKSAFAQAPYKQYLSTAFRELSKVDDRDAYLGELLNLIGTANYVGFTQFDIRSLLLQNHFEEVTTSNELVMSIALTIYGYQTKNTDMYSSFLKRLSHYTRQFFEMKQNPSLLNIMCFSMYRDLNFIYSGVTQVALKYCRVDDLVVRNGRTTSLIDQFTFASLMAIKGEFEAFTKSKNIIIKNLASIPEKIVSRNLDQYLQAIEHIGVGDVYAGNFKKAYKFLLFAYGNHEYRGDFSSALLPLEMIGLAFIRSGEKEAAKKLIWWLNNRLKSQADPKLRVEIRSTIASLIYDYLVSFSERNWLPR
jgi:hypothetical protein